MKTGFAIALAALLVVLQPGLAPGAASTPDPDEMIIPAEGRELSEFRWTKRPFVVFADSASDPRFVQQMDLINNRLDALADLDVVVIVDIDPASRSAIRTELRARDFMVVLISKEGAIVQRKPTPLDVRDLTRSVNKLPLRQQEIRDERDSLRE